MLWDLLSIRARGALSAGFLVLLFAASASVPGQAENASVWSQIVEKVNALDYGSVQEAVSVLRAGGPEANALWSDPRVFIRSRDPSVREDDLVMIIDMVSNKALTPEPDILLAGSSPFGTPAWTARDYVLTEAAIAITGPERGLLIRRKLPADTARTGFADEAFELTLWVERSLLYVVSLIHRLELEEDLEAVERFLVSPRDYLFEEAVRDGVWGTGLAYALLEQAHMVAYDLPLAEGTDTRMFTPPGLLSLPGTVTVAVGYVDENWCFAVGLAVVSGYE